MLVLVIGTALRNVVAITTKSSTSTPVAGSKRLTKHVIAEHVIVDTEKGPDGIEISQESSQPIINEVASNGVRHTLWRHLFAVPSSGKSE